MPGRFFLGALFGFIIASASYAARFLTLSGSLVTFLLAVIVFGIGGWQWTVPIVTFFVLSSLLSQFARSRKQELELVFEKSSTRDGGQVLANGGVPGLLVVLSVLYPIYDFYPLYLGALAAVTADTWGTEIGVLLKGKPVCVLTFRSVAVGTSGGVSASGTVGGAIGAGVIALSGYFWYADLRIAAAIVTAGLVGSFVDSMMGASVQAQFLCEVCGKTTERRIHCGHAAQRNRGVEWVGNDVVNSLCAMAGALAAWGLMLLVCPSPI